MVQNIKQVNIRLPRQCDDGEYEYLGKRYTLAPVTYDLDERYDAMTQEEVMEVLDVL